MKLINSNLKSMKRKWIFYPQWQSLVKYHYHCSLLSSLRLHFVVCLQKKRNVHLSFFSWQSSHNHKFSHVIYLPDLRLSFPTLTKRFKFNEERKREKKRISCVHWPMWKSNKIDWAYIGLILHRMQPNLYSIMMLMMYCPRFQFHWLHFHAIHRGCHYHWYAML